MLLSIGHHMSCLGKVAQCFFSFVELLKFVFSIFGTLDSTGKQEVFGVQFGVVRRLFTNHTLRMLDFLLWCCGRHPTHFLPDNLRS
jgi:hypothetical protein